MYTNKCGVKGPKGRSQQRRRDSVGKDLKELGITNWREKTRDRAEWRRTLSAAMYLIGSER
jgi:hypothetical protein